MMQRGDICFIDLPAPQGVPGREQAGSRPALIINSDNSINITPVVMVIPITSKSSASRYPHTILIQPSGQNGLTSPSYLLVFQLRALDRNRILNNIGQLETIYLKQVEQELKQLLGLA
jgi:mRNA interferase MazF